VYSKDSTGKYYSIAGKRGYRPASEAISLPHLPVHCVISFAVPFTFSSSYI